MDLKVSFPPHIRSSETIESIMYAVVISLVPALAFSIFAFGFRSLLVIVLSCLSCMLFEWACNKLRKTPERTFLDGSAIITGLLLAMNLPSNLPLPMVVLGAFVAIVFAKVIYGGLGFNTFNPALVARVFLLISFPAAMTLWPAPRGVDAVSMATPLGIVKTEGAQALSGLDLQSLFLGISGGCLGETSALALLLGAAFLLYRKVITLTIPLSFIVSMLIICSLAYLIDPQSHLSPVQHLFSGGLILGAFFMATDMVTSPLSAKGQLIFGLGCGVLTAIIRLWGAFPEGVSFAILIMNATVPLIEKWELEGRIFKGA